MLGLFDLDLACALLRFGSFAGSPKERPSKIWRDVVGIYGVSQSEGPLK